MHSLDEVPAQVCGSIRSKAGVRWGLGSSFAHTNFQLPTLAACRVEMVKEAGGIGQLK